MNRRIKKKRSCLNGNMYRFKNYHARRMIVRYERPFVKQLVLHSKTKFGLWHTSGVLRRYAWLSRDKKISLLSNKKEEKKMLKKVKAVEKVVKVFDTSELKIGDAYIMTVGESGMDIFDDVLSAGAEVFILVEYFNENEIRAVYIPRMTTTCTAQRFVITPDMNVELERVCE